MMTCCKRDNIFHGPEPSFFTLGLKRFDQMEKHLKIGLLAAEASLISEPFRLACKSVYENWVAIFSVKLQEDGFQTEQANILAEVISLMLEGAVTRSLTYKNCQPLQDVSDCIPLLLKNRCYSLLELYRLVLF